MLLSSVAFWREFVARQQNAPGEEGGRPDPQNGGRERDIRREGERHTERGERERERERERGIRREGVRERHTERGGEGRHKERERET